jgi:hypothetical protein
VIHSIFISVHSLKRQYDLAVAWNWDLDADFVSVIESAARVHGISVLQITRQNLDEVTEEISRGALEIGGYYDRASDEDDRFLPLTAMLENRFPANGSSGVHVVNPYAKAQRASDKALMHVELLANGIRVPHSLVIPSFDANPSYVVSAEYLRRLGSRFVAKPASSTGGGNGVLLGISSWEQVQAARESLREDKFLLQEIITPAYLGDFRAWFRIFFAFGETIPCWWDDQTHSYEEVSRDDEQNFGLSLLHETVRKIQQLCDLRFFSSEFAYSTSAEFVAIDYVNEICDMRPQSKFPNGVPDRIVEAIGRGLVRFFLEKKTNRSTY